MEKDHEFMKRAKHFVIYSIFYCILGLPIIATGSKGAEVVDRVVAVVNDDIIALFELNEAVKPYTDRIEALGYPLEKKRRVLFKVREDILNQLIDKKLTDQEIKRTNITVTEKEIDSAIERFKESGFHTDEELREALARQGLTMEAYRKRVKDQILRSKLLNIEVKSKIVITRKDVEAYYESHMDQYGGEKKYHLRNIIMQVSPYANENEKLLIFNKIKKVREKVEGGKSFKSMARTYSESPLAADDGDLGWFKLEEFSPQLQEAIKGLKAGEMTPILDTDQGYQLFYVEEIRITAGKTLEEAFPEIEKNLYREVSDNKFHAWLEDLRKKSHIKIIK
jgi:peptidyl-prolyl cis-trans isomerase SurA